MVNDDFNNIKAILISKKLVKPPAYAWQDLALRVIFEFNVPPQKKSSIFKICKNHSRSFVERCLNDTKELAEGERWKYFLKLINSKN